MHELRRIMVSVVVALHSEKACFLIFGYFLMIKGNEKKITQVSMGTNKNKYIDSRKVLGKA